MATTTMKKAKKKIRDEREHRWINEWKKDECRGAVNRYYSGPRKRKVKEN